MNRIVFFVYSSLTSSASEKASKISEYAMQILEMVQSLRLIQYLKIFISYLQVMSSFLGFHVVWPSSIVGAMIWCKTVFNFNLFSLPGVSCLWKGLGYNSKLVLYTLIPLGLGFMFWLPVAVISLLKYAKRSSEEQLQFMKLCSIIHDRFWNAIMFMLFLVSFCSQQFLIEITQSQV
jgi:hypothetical protein